MAVGAKRMKLVWRVIAVDGAGQCHGNCGHKHGTSLAAVRCRWAPPGWEQMLVCDLLVRQLRDKRVDERYARDRARARKAA